MSYVTAKERDVDIARLVAVVWARKRTVLFATVAFAGAGFAASSLVAPIYRAEAQLVIEGREAAYTGSKAGPDAPGETSIPDSAESPVSLLTSAEVLGTVAERLSLADREEFAEAYPVSGSLFSRIRPAAAAGQGDVIAAMRERLDVHPGENPLVFVVGFSSEDADLARDVPNAIAAEYFARRKSALPASNSDATGWLEGEIAGLREAVRTAEGRLAGFRAASDLSIGQDQAALATKKLSDLTSELSRTRAARAAGEGRALGIRDAIELGRSLDGVSEVLSSPTIRALRERQIALKVQIADLSGTLLDGHPRIRSARSLLSDVEAEIAGEAANVQSFLETASNMARQKEASLEREVVRLQAASARVGDAQVELRSLEREAAVQSQLLESYLARYREVLAQRTQKDLPLDARVFSKAQRPVEPYFPKIVPISAAAGLAGFLFSALAILLTALFSGRPNRPAVLAAPAAKPLASEGVSGRAAAGSRLSSGRIGRPDSASIPAPGFPARTTSMTVTGVVELGEAIVASEITRVLVVPAKAADPDGSTPASVVLARNVAGLSRPTILVDLTDGSDGARAMGVPADAVGARNLIDGTASFAEVIHRDLVSASHVLPFCGHSALRDAGDATVEIAAILDALEMAYGLTLVDCGAMPAETIRKLMTEDAALVVSVDPGEEAAGEATSQRLSAAGLSEIIVLSRASPTSGNFAGPTCGVNMI